MLKRLGNKEKKILFEALKTQFGFNKKLDYSFFINFEKKLFILNKNIDIDFSKIRINSLGLYFGHFEKELRLSIEGSQLIGPFSHKSILTLDDSQLQSWLYGQDLIINKDFKGFVLIKNKADFYGSGKYKDKKILNFIPKERRLKP